MSLLAASREEDESGKSDGVHENSGRCWQHTGRLDEIWAHMPSETVETQTVRFFSFTLFIFFAKVVPLKYRVLRK
jgi:hypothetical protein